MLFTIFEIANWFLAKESMTHKKLQKLCYYAQSWFLANHDEPLVMNRFEAWIHGPVCPDLYTQYKDYGCAKIPQVNNNLCMLEPNIQNFLQEIWNTYGGYCDFELENMSKTEYPWKHARKNVPASHYSRNPISWTDMQNYYKNRRENS